MQVKLLIVAILISGVQPAFAAAPAAANPVDVAHVDVAQEKSVEIVSQSVSGVDQDDVTVVLKPKGEHFSIDFHWEGTRYRHLKILVVGGKQWQAIRYYPTIERGRAHFFDLLETPGVSINQIGNACEIEFFTAAAVRLLPPSGRLIFRFREGEGPKIDSAPIGIKNPPKQ